MINLLRLQKQAPMWLGNHCPRSASHNRAGHADHCRLPPFRQAVVIQQRWQLMSPGIGTAYMFGTPYLFAPGPSAYAWPQ